jgi:predicted CxxxxCH...CXXCH cytochrome family protein
MKMLKNSFLGIVAILTISACGPGPGPDAISSHPTLSGQAGSCTTLCHSAQSTISPDPIRTNGTGTAGKHVAHVQSRGIVCDVCHSNYFSQLTHFNGTLDTGNASAGIVNFNLTGPTGSWTTAGRGIGTCSSVACHGPVVMDWYGTAGFTLPSCQTCHTSGFDAALDPVATNGAGTSGKHGIHVTDHAIPCERCHNGYTTDNTHTDGVLNVGDPNVSLVSFDATNPTGTWTNAVGPQTGSCAALDCHNGVTLGWYSTNTWTTPTDCRACHGAPAGTRRQVLAGAATGTGGDFNQQSHHIIDYANRNVEKVSVPADCLVCHDMATHMSGTVRLRNKDNAGQVVVYQPASPASLEPFCLSCHDTGGAATETVPLKPFANGNTLGAGLNVAGNKISGYWNSAFTTHKNNGLTCAGTGAPNTGCHGSNGAINGHGSVSRGLLAQNMTFTIGSSASFNANDYKLCFNCHDNYPAVTKEVVLGYRLGGNYDKVPTVEVPPTPYYTAGIQSLFRDRFIALPANFPAYWLGINQPYNNNFEFAAVPGLIGIQLPLHNFHLLGIEDLGLPSPPNQLTWKYRGDAAQTGRITCTACHNVHGTTNGIRNTYDEFQLTRGTGVSPDLFVTFPGAAALTPIMTLYPFNCAGDCHGANGLTTPMNYWHTPANE